MKAIGVIPARLHSTRFPKKILHLIEGKPMVAQVYEKACKAKSLDEVIVAIDADETAVYNRFKQISYGSHFDRTGSRTVETLRNLNLSQTPLLEIQSKTSMQMKCFI